MGKRKPHVLDENDDEYKTANARFKNPFHKTLDYTLTSASAEGSQLQTIQETRSVSYNPPTIPVIVEPPKLPNIPEVPEPAASEPKKTQVSPAKWLVFRLWVSHEL